MNENEQRQEVVDRANEAEQRLDEADRQREDEQRAKEEAAKSGLFIHWRFKD